MSLISIRLIPSERDGGMGMRNLLLRGTAIRVQHNLYDEMESYLVVMNDIRLWGRRTYIRYTICGK